MFACNMTVNESHTHNIWLGLPWGRIASKRVHDHDLGTFIIFLVFILQLSMPFWWIVVVAHSQLEVDVPLRDPGSMDVHN